jgi:RNA polymerase sigma-70 factor (ECF subfamily)
MMTQHPVHCQDWTTPVPRLASLYATYGEWLRRRLAMRFGNDQADELAQETWARAIPVLAADQVRHPRAFLLRVATNAAADFSSRQRVRENWALTAPRVVERPDQEECVLAKELILGLPQPLRDVFVLSRFAGLTNVEIGERLGISPKTVEWRMTKALAHCAAQLRR